MTTVEMKYVKFTDITPEGDKYGTWSVGGTGLGVKISERAGLPLGKITWEKGIEAMAFTPWGIPTIGQHALREIADECERRTKLVEESKQLQEQKEVIECKPRV